MTKKSFLLLTTAGLLALAFASPPAASPARGNDPAQRRQFLDSLRTLPREARRAAKRQWLDTRRAGRQASHEQKPAEPRKLDAYTNPFEDPAIMPAPYDDDHNQQWPAVTFDATNSKYLVVWNDDRDADWYVYGALVPTSGTPSSNEAGFEVSVGDCDYEAPPAVAFGGGYYLVAWQNADYNGIYCRLVSSSGVPQGTSDIEIGQDDEHIKLDPAVAFDGTNFVVVWDDDRGESYSHLYGARVNPSTGLLQEDEGGRLIWGPEDCDQFTPSLAFDGTNYLVVWSDDRDDGADIYGLLLSQELAPLAPETPIATPGYEERPAVAFDGTNYLVVWQDWVGLSDNDVSGQRVNTSGGLVGSVIGIATGTTATPYPDVTFNGSDHFVVWQDYDDGDLNIYGSRVSLGGDPEAFDEPVAGATYEEGLPAMASGPVEGKVMVAYQGVPGGGYGNYNRILARRASLTLGAGDVGTVSVERPVASYLLPSWDIPPMAQLKNYGSATRSFYATFAIKKGATEVYSKTRTVLGLEAGATRAVTFYPFEIETGLFTSKCTTMLAGDGTTGNDKATAIFQGCDFMYFFDEDNHTEFSGSTDGGWGWGLLTWSGWAPPAMDETIWGVGHDGDYDPNKDGRLVSPTFDVTEANPSIVFQHNYEIEDADDGGNFSYSTNGGSSWSVLEPVDGLDYTGYPSKLDPDPGWTGSSSGWKQSVFTIPVSSGTFAVSWRFASDGSANERGWLIDEVAGVGFPVDLKAGRPPKPGAAINAVSISSNPLRGVGLLTYTLVRACKVSVKLFDATGRLVRPVATAGFREGVNTARLDASGLNPGVYFVKLMGDGDIKTAKVIIE